MPTTTNTTTTTCDGVTTTNTVTTTTADVVADLEKCSLANPSVGMTPGLGFGGLQEVFEVNAPVDKVAPYLSAGFTNLGDCPECAALGEWTIDGDGSAGSHRTIAMEAMTIVEVCTNKKCAAVERSRILPPRG